MPPPIGGGLPFGLGLGGGVFEVAIFVRQPQNRVALLLDRRDALGEHRHQGSIRRESAQAGPGFRCGSSPIGLDQANGHAFFLPQIPGKKVCHRRRVGHGFGRAGHPGLGLHVRQGMVGGFLVHLKQTNLGIAGRRDFSRGIGNPRHRQFHVRLPGCHPDIAHENVAQGQGVIALNGHLERTAGLAGG